MCVCEKERERESVCVCVHMMHACAQCAGFCCLHSTLCNTRFKACRLCAIICPVIHQSCTVLCLATLIFCSQQLSHTWQPCSHHAALYCLALDNPGFVQLSAVSCLANLVLCSHWLSHTLQPYFSAVIMQPCTVLRLATLVLFSCQLFALGNPGFVQLSAVSRLATLVLCRQHAIVSCLMPGNPGFVQSPCSCQLSHAWQPWFCAVIMQLSAVSCLASLFFCRWSPWRWRTAKES